jgi:hypothetical protein
MSTYDIVYQAYYIVCHYFARSLQAVFNYPGQGAGIWAEPFPISSAICFGLVTSEPG